MADDLYAQFGLPIFCLIDNYVVDVFVREEHSFESEVTNLPLESGSSTVDNVWTKPAAVTVEGIVSNTPLQPAASQRSDPQSAPSEAYQKMLAIRAAKKPVTIVTSLDNYPNMLMTGLEVTKGPGEGGFLRFTAKFSQADFVSIQKAKPAIPTANTPKKKTKTLGALPANTSLIRFVTVPRSLVSGSNVSGNGSFVALWFDNSIGAWRQNANPHKTQNYWVVFRGLPYGFSNDNVQPQSDGTYSPAQEVDFKRRVQAAQMLSDTVSVAVSPYNPLEPNVTQDQFTEAATVISSWSAFIAAATIG